MFYFKRHFARLVPSRKTSGWPVFPGGKLRFGQRTVYLMVAWSTHQLQPSPETAWRPLDRKGEAGSGGRGNPLGSPSQRRHCCELHQISGQKRYLKSSGWESHSSQHYPQADGIRSPGWSEARRKVREPWLGQALRDAFWGLRQYSAGTREALRNLGRRITRSDVSRIP